MLKDGGAFLGGEIARFVSRNGVVVIDFDGGSAFGLEAEVDIEHVHKAAQEQACADEEHAGEGDFGDDKDGADALMLAALAGAGAGVFEGLMQIATGHA